MFGAITVNFAGFLDAINGYITLLTVSAIPVHTLELTIFSSTAASSSYSGSFESQLYFSVKQPRSTVLSLILLEKLKFVICSFPYYPTAAHATGAISRDKDTYVHRLEHAAFACR